MEIRVGNYRDYIGKWFNNIDGIPDDYSLILSIEKIDSAPIYKGKYVVTSERYKKPKFKEFKFINLYKSLGESVKDSMTLNKVKINLIKGLFDK